MAERLDRIECPPVVAAIWERALAAPASSEPVWLHGDLHPGNIVALNGAITGVIDWGDMKGGDAATDLACAWMLLPEPADRTRFFESYGASESVIARAAGWAVLFGTSLIEWGAERPVLRGHRTLSALGQDFGHHGDQA